MTLIARLKQLCLLLSLCLFIGTAGANDHGGGGGGGEQMRFTVNVLPDGNRYLQVEMLFETATPEASQMIAALKPRVQHHVILLLSSQNVTHLLTREGKKELMEEIVDKVNEVIESNPKKGVKEVLFTSFIIQ